MITPSHVRIAAKLAKLESQCLGSAFYCFTRLLKQTNAFTRGGSGFRLFQSLRFDSRHPCDEQVLRRFKLTGIQKKVRLIRLTFLVACLAKSCWAAKVMEGTTMPSLCLVVHDGCGFQFWHASTLVIYLCLASLSFVLENTNYESK